MSTVLTKPVLLDETGQAIVGKLDEIKEAIDNGGTEKYPVLIHITTMPSKTSYIAGEQLNLAGMVVKAVFSNNVEYDVTDQCTFSPANGTVLTSSDTSVTATYTWHPTGTSFTATQAITVKGIVGISVATPPTKTDYIINEALDLTGMVVHLDYDDNTYDDITADCTYVPANGATLDDDTLTAVAISYYEPILATTLTTSQAISVVIPVYGASWDGSASSIWTRTDLAADFEDPNPYYANMTDEPSSPFDNISPWKDLEVINDTAAGKLVKIPKFYYKWTADGDTLKLQVSTMQLDGFSTSPAHSDRGDGQGERDEVYVGAFHCNQVDWKSDSVTPSTNRRYQTCMSSIHQLGADIYSWDMAMYWTIAMLYLVEFADWNSQKVIGHGGDSSVLSYASNIPYHTGTNGATRATSAGVKYRNIDGLWSGVRDWIGGLRLECNQRGYNNYAIQKNPNDFSSGNNFVLAGQNQLSRGSTLYVTKMIQSIVSDYSYALFPKTALNDASISDEYICDSVYYFQDESYARVTMGGAYSSYASNPEMGLFCTRYEQTSTESNYVGARLMKLPNNT